MATALQRFQKKSNYPAKGKQKTHKKSQRISISPTHTQFVQEITKVMALSTHEVRVQFYI